MYCIEDDPHEPEVNTGVTGALSRWFTAKTEFGMAHTDTGFPPLDTPVCDM
jgi:hypothetical protein